MKMVRLQDDQYKALAKMSDVTGVPIARQVRDAVGLYLRSSTSLMLLEPERVAEARERKEAKRQAAAQKPAAETKPMEGEEPACPRCNHAVGACPPRCTCGHPFHMLR